MDLHMNRKFHLDLRPANTQRSAGIKYLHDKDKRELEKCKYDMTIDR
jgi:hypothetical protein